MNKPSVRIGSEGYGENKEVQEFIEELTKREIIVNKGGVMNIGVWLLLPDGNHDISELTVDQVKELLKTNNISIE